MRPQRPRLVIGWPLLVAVAPAVVLAGLGLHLNHFALLDDWVSVARTHAAFGDNFRFSDSGRFNFFYWLFYWVVARLLAPAPWAFSLANGAFVVAAAWQIYALVGRWGGARLGGIAAAWLFTLNSSTIENLFTLGKGEPKQLVCWLAALALLGRPLEGRPDPGRGLEMVLVAAASASAVLFKETALLLGIPLAVFVVITAASWADLPASDRRRRAGLLVGCAVPLLLGTAIAVLHGMQPGSYAREEAMARPLAVGQLEIAIFQRDAILGALLTAALLAGLARVAATPRAPVVLAVSQLLAVASLYTYLRTIWPYYYYPAVALAGLILGVVLFPSRPRALVWRVAAMAVVVVFGVYGATQAIVGASALAGWSWLHERLVSSVVAGRPPRALFYESGPWEVQVEARLTWEDLHALPLVTGVLDPSEPVKPQVRPIAVRDLAPGDWILEEFGDPSNRRVPFRGIDVVRPAQFGLLGSASQGMLPLRLRHRFVARFRLPVSGFDLFEGSTGSLEWRIYEVTDPPCVVLEGLTQDRWMGARASMWVRRGDWDRIILRFRPVTPRGTPTENELRIRSGSRTVAACRVIADDVHRCTVPASVIWRGDAMDRQMLELEAARSFSPKSLGLGPDTRDLSFNFQPTWEAGLDGLFEPDGARTARSCGVAPAAGRPQGPADRR